MLEDPQALPGKAARVGYRHHCQTLKPLRCGSGCDVGHSGAPIVTNQMHGAYIQALYDRQDIGGNRLHGVVAIDRDRPRLIAPQRQDYAFIRKLWRDWSPGWQPEPGMLNDVIKTLSQPGVRSAALGYYRAALSIKALLVSAEEAHYAVPVPTLAMSGERDGCIACDVFERLTVADDFPQGVTFHRVSGAGHFLHQEKPEVVNALLLDWLSSQSA